ncbi:TonB-dependent receptor plug domain-containing protein [Flavobacterium sp. '19STA2R22 D10 B1']|uniref:TonB-dependent receptor plug domain-containing protein n=1 Tax=Flavobacterium aerium TaxID=3037261 RepID=UPI00278C8AD2|nr:TonB-dependent receptor [Flavobacterium sp. '19STA2R22 D10 B1']
MQINKGYFLLLSSFLGFSSYAQTTEQDSIRKENKLNEVVVTGQFEPQSINKSVFNVRVISNQDIQNLAANNLGDVLNQYLNITVRPSGNDGRSTVSLFGLDAQYFKILVDNVPLANEAGLGNNIDLTQINLNDVERIEIIEGSMGVTHGANAVSGILNIISKKSSKHKWSITATAQEETVNKEFSFFKQGRHIQSLRLAHNLSENWYISAGVNRNDFQGYLGDKKGKDYKENDFTRGYSWLPKEQLISNALISYHKNNFRVFYKFEYLDENTDYFNTTVQSGYNSQLGSYLYSDDKRYFTNRYYHHLNAVGKLFSQLNYNVSVSHQRQAREIEDFRYNITNGDETLNKRVQDQSMEVTYSTGTVSNFFSDSKVDLQLGYEFVNNNGFSLIQDENIISPVRKRLENYDFFVNSEIKATESFYLRPGLRFSSQSKFDDQYASSLGLRYLFGKGVELRGSLGKSFRTPTFDELYSKLIFDGHHFTGNENLIPETSTSYEISLKKGTYFKSGLVMTNTITTSFLNVKDRIDMAFIKFNSAGIPEYQYINISKYNMWNVSTNHQLKQNNWMFNFGASLVGVSRVIENQLFSSDDKFLYSFNLNTSISYSIPKWGTVFSAYYKYNGKTQQYIEGNSEFVISDIEASNWLDASIRKSFFKNRLDFMVGARNLLDVTNVNQTRTAEGGGHATSSNIMLAYGRSYYAKLTYNLNF